MEIKYKITVVILSLLLIASLVVNGFQYTDIQKMTKNEIESKKTISVLEKMTADRSLFYEGRDAFLDNQICNNEDKYHLCNVREFVKTNRVKRIFLISERKNKDDSLRSMLEHYVPEIGTPERDEWDKRLLKTIEEMEEYDKQIEELDKLLGDKINVIGYTNHYYEIHRKLLEY